MQNNNHISRRRFIAATGAVAGASIVTPVAGLNAVAVNSEKMKIVLVGAGIRGTGMWGRTLMQRFSDRLEFVGLCDNNSGRVEAAKQIIGVNCRTYSNMQNPMVAFEQMMQENRPELVIVCTTDSTHVDYIVRGMELGANIITEKPMATESEQIQRIIDSEKATGKTTRVTFNYRYSPYRAKIYELLRAGEIGDIVSVDMNYYLDISHGADYFRRWHGLTDKGGTLWVHKASHHFDLLSWWIDSEPESVYALGELEHYGKNGPFRGTNCRNCQHTRECQYFWQIERPMQDFQQEASGMTTRPQGPSTFRLLYLDNEHIDGYFRDGCVYRQNIDIFDKMAATIRYMNGVQVSYSLTTYSPYEGYRIAFNGSKGRIDAWIEESNPTIPNRGVNEIVLFKNFGRRQFFFIPTGSGHGGGDALLLNQIFIPETPDPLKQFAGSRDGAFSCLTGIAARKSIASKQPVKIADLTSLKPQPQKEYTRT